MDKQIRLIALIGLFTLVLFPLVSSADGTSVVQEELNEQVCYNETHLNELINQRKIISEEKDYYQNLSKYYEELYLSKEINVTNRELISLHQNISILQQNITNLEFDLTEIKNEVSFIKLTFKLSLSLISITFIGLVLFRIKFIKKWITKFISY